MALQWHAMLSGTVLFIAGCHSEASAPDPTEVVARPMPMVAEKVGARSSTVGSPIAISLAGLFTDPENEGLSYSASFSPETAELALNESEIVGVVTSPSVIFVRLTARDAAGDTASQTFSIATFAPGLPTPDVAADYGYSDGSVPVPPWYAPANPLPGTSALAASNMPPTNVTTDKGAALGRVLFHDVRLSANDRVSCASCHQQRFGFSDTAQFSTGFAGGKTARHSMALANARFYVRGRFFWDERAPTLEAQVLLPIQNSVEMGLTLDQLVAKVGATSYYQALLSAAFGTPAVTPERIARALAQYVRSISSYGSRFDSAFDAQGRLDLTRLTGQEAQGFALFTGAGRCLGCHGTNAQISDNIHNSGLDATISDRGAGKGAFKAPSLRNVAVRGRYMHDGRFTSLEQVVDFYSTGIQPNADLDVRLQGSQNGEPVRFNFTADQRDALVAYLKTLTDKAMLSDPRFSDPFSQSFRRLATHNR